MTTTGVRPWATDVAFTQAPGGTTTTLPLPDLAPEGGPMATPDPMTRPTPRICSIDGCDRPHKGRGLCAMHLKRLHRNGDPLIRSLGLPVEYTRNVDRTHCKADLHPWSPETTYFDRHGKRHCIPCRQAHEAEFLARAHALGMTRRTYRAYLIRGGTP